MVHRTIWYELSYEASSGCILTSLNVTLPICCYWIRQVYATHGRLMPSGTPGLKNKPHTPEERAVMEQIKTLNFRTYRNKEEEIRYLMNNWKINIFGISETKLKRKDVGMEDMYDMNRWDMKQRPLSKHWVGHHPSTQQEQKLISERMLHFANEIKK